MSTKIVKLAYPIRGVWFSAPLSHQPAQSSQGALNCRSFDQVEDALKGGPRHGNSKWHAATVNGTTAVVQDINALTTTVSPT